MPKKNELVSGVVSMFLFSPKGGIEGVLLATRKGVVQLSMSSDEGNVLVKSTAPGTQLHALGVADHSPKTEDAAHPVYRLESLANAKGDAIDWPESDDDADVVEGVVSALHFAKHGEPNGVLLEGGEFVHLRPHGMSALELAVGATVRATGSIRTTVLGTRLIEADEVNGIPID